MKCFHTSAEILGELWVFWCFNGALVSNGCWPAHIHPLMPSHLTLYLSCSSCLLAAFLYWLKSIILSLILFPRFSRSHENVAVFSCWEVLAFIILPYSTEWKLYNTDIHSIDWRLAFHQLSSGHAISNLCIVKNSAFHTGKYDVYNITWKLHVSYPEQG